MEKIWKSSTNVFLLQIIASGLAYGVTKNPVWIFVLSTFPVFLYAIKNEGARCYGVIGLLAVMIAGIFPGDDVLFVAVVTTIAMWLVAIVVAGIEASDAKLYHEAREPMSTLFFAGLPYGVGMVFGAMHSLSYRRRESR